MSPTKTNNHVRKSLAEQIDRLDSILDGLAEALNEAVAIAVKEAVHAVLTEVLTNPAIAEKLRGMAAPAYQSVNATPKPGLLGRLRRCWSWIKQGVWSICQAVGNLIQQGPQTCRTLVRRMCQNWTSFWTKVQAVRHYKMQMLTAAGVGMAVGTAAYFAGPWLAAGVSAIGGVATTLAVQAGLWLRRTLRMPAIPNA
jgi:hypothetical protein